MRDGNSERHSILARRRAPMPGGPRDRGRHDSSGPHCGPAGSGPRVHGRDPGVTERVDRGTARRGSPGGGREGGWPIRSRISHTVIDAMPSPSPATESRQAATRGFGCRRMISENTSVSMSLACGMVMTRPHRRTTGPIAVPRRGRQIDPLPRSAARTLRTALHGTRVCLKAAARQFPLTHPAVSCIMTDLLDSLKQVRADRPIHVLGRFARPRMGSQSMPVH